MAPQTTDLDWGRLVKGKFAAQFLRDWLVGIAIWFFIIFWIFPISFITGLVSIKTLETVFPPLTKFFERNPRSQSLITGLIPTLLVAGLGILIPVILFAIGRKAQTEVTFSGLHDGILSRYYKWLIANIVIFFCIGLTSFRTFLLAFKQKVPDPFSVVAEAFPAAAPFYASWFILQTSLQNMMQLGLVGLPLITYVFGVRKASTPRKRKRGTQPRTIDYHYWTPNHLLAMHIVMIFAVLNPLVIPFALIYYSVANVVFRNQLLHVYARRFYEDNGKRITTRVLRYSMDGLALSHVVFLAFNLLNFNKARAGISGTMLGVTVLLKIWATREFKARYERLEDAESARLCGHEEPFLAAGERSSNEERRPKTNTLSPNTPLSLERLDSFQTPVAAMAPSPFSWNPPGLKTISHGYNMHRIRNNPMTTKRKGKSSSLSIIPSTSGSRVEILRPDSPGTSDEASVLSAGTKSPQPGLLDRVQRQVVQAPGNLLGYFAGKASSQVSLHDGENYLGGTRPHELIVAQPPLKRWDDTPDGSASYECPYYLDESPTAIWLPRDPSGPIDLDDTVLMYRLLLSIHRSGTSDSRPKSTVNIGGTKSPDSETNRRLSSVTRDSEKSSIAMPITASPAGSPGETPQLTSSYSSRAARPNLLRIRTVSADRVSNRSFWSRRQSISETLEMANIQPTADAQPADSLPVPLGETSAQGALARKPSFLSVFRPQRRSGGEGIIDGARPISMFSHNSIAVTDGEEPRTERRKGRIMHDDEALAKLDQVIDAEEARYKEKQHENDKAEKLEDQRVESEETKGWSVLKRLVLQRNQE